MGIKCICKVAPCAKCSPNTFSTGGINPQCRSCPSERPYTFEGSAQKSDDSCVENQNDVKCKSGEGYESRPDIRSDGRCMSYIKTNADCINAAENNRKNGIDHNKGKYPGDGISSSDVPPP